MATTIDDRVKRIIQKLPADKWNQCNLIEHKRSYEIELPEYYIDLTSPEGDAAALKITYEEYDTEKPMIFQSGPEIDALYQKVSSFWEELIKIRGLEKLEKLLNKIKIKN